VPSVGEQAAEETEGQGGHHHNQKPVRGESVGIGSRCQDDISKEVVKVVEDRCNAGRDHEPSEDDPGEITFVKRPQEFADRLAERAPWVWSDRSQALVARCPDRRDQGEQDDDYEDQVDRSGGAHQ